ncbi:adenylyl-sulfate kinase [Shewanella eurypsychrophilus]|uniref:Adenylyl-sulfate kinase n=1 Tax=Shewanella eurypsychrophilus TaxID=2593656 RepID=A0ABX6VAS9_9GAMM|nr:MULTISPECIES: adenylyl-sulfate kinase [Shewanella]QFU23421.1 adenylyl-sulfate kinase [Shewanella sp. YLB-09]QPG58649.1 adenylyl-sulfate kinase [Shewanella eurypsychrophilus]
MSPYKAVETEDKSSDVVWHLASVSHEERVKSHGHRPAVLWFTGLSGSGKSTVANAVDKMLHDLGCKTYLLDGDNVRHGLNGDLGFSDQDRVENIRRIGEVSKLFADAGLLVSTAFISPFTVDRELVRGQLQAGQFIEVFIDTPVEICEQRDPKGLYKKARAGEIKNFTGIDSAYELPLQPEVHVKTAEHSIEACAKQVVDYLKSHGYLKAVSS